MKKTHPFFHWNFGHLLTIIVMVAGFVVFYGNIMERLSKIETDVNWIKHILKINAEITNVATSKQNEH